MKQPLQTAGRVRLPYTRRRSDARCVTSLSRLPDVPELNSYDPEFFTVRLQRPLPARNQCVTQDMATWLLWAEVPVSWGDLSWAVANPALPPERLSLY